MVAGSMRAAAIGALNMQRAGAEAGQWAGARTLFTTPAWAEIDRDYNSVFYPEPEVEVGEAAPDFSLPGERLHKLLAPPVTYGGQVLVLPFPVHG